MINEPPQELYVAQPCGCRSPNCTDWHVWPVAAVQGVRFTEEQAKFVAELLNELEGADQT